MQSTGILADGRNTQLETVVRLNGLPKMYDKLIMSTLSRRYARVSNARPGVPAMRELKRERRLFRSQILARPKSNF